MSTASNVGLFAYSKVELIDHLTQAILLRVDLHSVLILNLLAVWKVVKYKKSKNAAACFEIWVHELQRNIQKCSPFRQEQYYYATPHFYLYYIPNSQNLSN